MAISEDLMSVHVALADIARAACSDTAPVIRLACANLLALAEQVETLETMPLDMEHTLPQFFPRVEAVLQ